MTRAALTAVPPGVVTEMGPLDAPFGTVQTIWSAVSVTMEAAVPLMSTPNAPDRFVPEMVTFAPTRVWRGVRAVMEGIGGGGGDAEVARMTMSVPVVPTARHVEASVHETALMCSTPAGTVAPFQVPPPSVVDDAVPVASNPLVLTTMLSPTMKQSELLVHEIPSTSLVPVRLWAVHVVPPRWWRPRWVRAEPTSSTADAQQSVPPRGDDAEEGVAARRGLGGPGVPAVVVATTGSPEAVAARAQQFDAVGHETDVEVLDGARQVLPVPGAPAVGGGHHGAGLRWRPPQSSPTSSGTTRRSSAVVAPGRFGVVHVVPAVGGDDDDTGG